MVFILSAFRQTRSMRREFASVIEKRGKWYVALVEETPGVKRSERKP